MSEKFPADKSYLNFKKVWNVSDLALYTGWEEGTINNMISKRTIPHSKPSNGRVFFDKDKMENWLLSNYKETCDEIESRY